MSLELGRDLSIPDGAAALVIFAHGSGSSRFSPRNRHVARLLNQRRLATLLVDLLTPDEEARDAVSGELRFNINLLAERLVGVTDWASREPETRRLAPGYFGGGNDPQVLGLNRMALAHMSYERQLVVVPRASHLFEEPGALDEVARFAGDWFLRYLIPAPQPA